MIGFFMLSICSITLTAQPAPKSYERQANYIYLLTRFLGSPQISKNENFVIGVYADEKIANEMKGYLKNKKYENKDIKVKLVTTLSELSSCAMLFIPDAKKEVTDKLITHSLKSSTIIITQEDVKRSNGTCINFSEKHGKLKIEIDESEMKKRDVKMQPELAPFLVD
jgi:Fe-S cluster assembly iron-binding protein IscA